MTVSDSVRLTSGGQCGPGRPWALPGRTPVQGRGCQGMLALAKRCLDARQCFFFMAGPPIGSGGTPR
jgi:hypothetical protein